MLDEADNHDTSCSMWFLNQLRQTCSTFSPTKLNKYDHLEVYKKYFVELACIKGTYTFSLGTFQTTTEAIIIIY